MGNMTTTSVTQWGIDEVRVQIPVGLIQATKFVYVGSDLNVQGSVTGIIVTMVFSWYYIWYSTGIKNAQFRTE